ncbi:hypothetical protein WA026_004912 [Henosepilachna vigintioctopunctata]|uniref:peptidylprolyl isomerase n=1 Tax=Henosepilachna vigintioctopunctata TaxID=420089 RepID=A0AAW1UKC7_9CUCU
MSIDSENNISVSDEENLSNAKTNSETTESNDDKPTDEWIDLLGSGSINKKILKEGTPESRPERQQVCVINYELFLNENDIIEKKENYEIDLGDYDVVQGLDLSIGLMNIGEICLLRLEPRLAFGIRGLPPKINGEVAVTYKVELISARDEDLEALNINERKKKGNHKRERGNWWYGRGENNIAVQCYRKALDYLDEVEGGIKFSNSEDDEITDSILQELLEDRISVYNNLAAAQIKLESYDAALNSLKTVLQCQPQNIKALYRQAKIYKAKNNVSSAMKALQKAKEIAPNDPDIQNELAKLKQLVDKQKKTERELAKRMFGSTFKSDKKQPNSKKVYVWATVAASVAVGLAGLATYRFKFF